MGNSSARSPVASTLGAVLSLAALAVIATDSATAHIDYVTDGAGETGDPIAFAVEVLSQPENALLFGGTGLLGGVALLGYLWVRPTIPDIDVLRATLSEYRDLVPWMLRLSMGLPLIGAGFAGYYFSPAVETAPRLLMIGLGFFLLFGLATRFVAAVGLVAYLVGLASDLRLLLSMEYVPGLLAIVLLGGGRPSADHMLGAVANAEGTLYGRVDPFHRLGHWFAERVAPFARYAPSVIRVGLGVTFVYLGLVEKILQPGRALQVVEQYDLTAIVPVDPGAWVLGAGLAEIALGVLLIGGLLTRGVAAAAFVVFTLTMFGLPDDPVLAHVTMFGLASAVFTLGSGPLALDNFVTDAEHRTNHPTPAD
ncbi:DoxX family membrane protein [Halorientalis salina]|uniref:DoxX family membrane protein n=1 Tax=Halorientalis salina TaxID=2932266 RepID=UPI0010AC2109|nr:DoxX family membrane protein [Halorientalis salina]